MKFCHDRNFRDCIVDLLYNLLFNNNIIQKSEINGWYDSFINNFCRQGLGEYMEMASCFPFSIPNMNQLYLGHDLPVWIEGSYNDYINPGCSSIVPGNTGNIGDKKVMIIGQDPMRTNSKNIGKLTIASPWGIHYPLGYTSKHSELYINIVKPLLDKNFCVYVTDYYKLYATQQCPSAKDSRNNVAHLADYDKIISQEIEFVNPDYIILMGSHVIMQHVVNAIPASYSGSIRCMAHIKARFDAGCKSGYFDKLLKDIK